MQHVLVASKKCPLQGCENAVAHSRRATKKVECANAFYLLYFVHKKALWQSLSVCYYKLLRDINIHRKFCSPGLVTGF